MDNLTCYQNVSERTEGSNCTGFAANDISKLFRPVRSNDSDSGIDAGTSSSFLEEVKEEQLDKDEDLTEVENSISKLEINEQTQTQIEQTHKLYSDIDKKIQHYLITALTPDIDNDTYLTIYLAQGRIPECAKLIQLCPRSIYLDTQNNRGQTAMHVAAWLNISSIVKMLITQNARIDLADSEGKNVLHIAAERGNYETVKTIFTVCKQLDKFKELKHIINETNYAGLTPFFVAVANKHQEICKFLSAEEMVDVNSRDVKTGNSPLHEAVIEQNHAKFIHMLLKDCKLDVNAQNCSGVTPLHIAAAIGDRATCSVLLLLNADVNICDNNGHVPVVYAEDKEIIQYLIQK